MEIYPAIDLIAGQAVRLTRGDYSSKKVYDRDPVSVAMRFKESGASNLHVVDLDGAKTGSPVNMPRIRELCAIDGLFVQVGGGIRTMERIEEYIALGVDRVILGTAAVKDPKLLISAIKRYNDKIAVGVDARDGKAALSGWLERTDIDSVAFCRELRDKGVKTVIYTDIARDGAMSGTNREIYSLLNGIDGLSVIASGGICFESDVLALKAMGIYGAIIGKALYEGAIELKRVIMLAGTEKEL